MTKTYYGTPTSVVCLEEETGKIIWQLSFVKIGRLYNIARQLKVIAEKSLGYIGYWTGSLDPEPEDERLEKFAVEVIKRYYKLTEGDK